MKTACFVAALLLAGCGGGSGDSPAGAGPAAPPPAPGPVAGADAFVTSVQGLLGRDADGEPVAVESGATPVEDREPQVLN